MPRGRRDWLHRLLTSASTISGDIVECGVGKGKSLDNIAEFVVNTNSCKRVYAFESWGPFTVPGEHDSSTEARNCAGVTVGDKAIVLQRLGERVSVVTFVDGYIEETLPQWPPRPLSFIHLDLDLYQPYKTALMWLWPLLNHGGVMVFDEYLEPKYPGAKIAVDEYFTGRGVAIQDGLRAWVQKT